MANVVAELLTKPPEIVIMVLTKYFVEEAERVFAEHQDLGQVCADNFPVFVKRIFDEFRKTPYNSEIRHLLYRIISIKFNYRSERPFEKLDDGPREYALWLKEFIERSDGNTPPEIPRTIKTLQYIRRLLESMEFLIRRIQFDRSKTYEPMGSTKDKLHILRQDDYEDEHSFNKVESYRIRRALMIYQLYSMLFRYSRRRGGTLYNGHISEQMLFIQSLQPFLLKELDAIYGMIECNLAANWNMGTSICRRATPLDPGRGAVPSGSKLEYIMSLGLLQIKDMLQSDEDLAEFYDFSESPQGSKDNYISWCGRFTGDIGNRFFTRPLRYYSERIINLETIMLPNMVSPDMARWRDAPDGTNGPSWLARSFSNPNTSPGIRDQIAVLILNDPQNWNGLAFWEKDRLIRHFQLLQSDPVINQAFPIADYDTESREHQDWFISFDPPNRPYVPVHLSPSSFATYISILR